MANVSGAFGPNVPLQQAAGTPPAAGGATPPATPPAPATPPMTRPVTGYYSAQTKYVADIFRLTEDADNRFAKVFPTNVTVGRGRRARTVTVSMTWRAKFADLMNAIAATRRPIPGEASETTALRTALRTTEGRRLLKALKENPSHKLEDAVGAYSLNAFQVQAIRNKLSQWLQDQDKFIFTESVDGLLNRMGRNDANAFPELLALITYRTGKSPEEAMKHWFAAVAAVIPDPAQRTAAKMDSVSADIGQYLYAHEGAGRKAIPVPVEAPVAPPTGAAGPTPAEVAEQLAKRAVGRSVAIANLKTADLTTHDIPAAVMTAVNNEEAVRQRIEQLEKDLVAAGSDAAKKASVQAELTGARTLYASKMQATDKAVEDWLKQAQSALDAANARLAAANADTSLTPADKQAKIDAAQAAINQATEQIKRIQSLSPQAKTEEVAAYPIYLVNKQKEQSQAALAAAEKAKADADKVAEDTKWKKDVNTEIDKGKARANVKLDLRAGFVGVGDTTSPLGRLKLVPSIEKPLNGSVALGVEGEVDINKGGYRPGEGSSAQDLFGPGVIGSISGGGIGVSSLSPYAKFLGGMLTTKLGMNEIWVDQFAPINGALGKNVLPGAINVIAGPQVVVDSDPKFDESKSIVRGWGTAAYGVPVDSINLAEEEGIAFVKGQNGNLAKQFDVAASLQLGAKLDDTHKSSVVLNGHLVGTTKDDNTLWDSMLNISGRGLYNNWRFNFDWRPINDMAYQTAYQNGKSHWALATEGGYDFGKITLIGAFSHASATILRTIASGGDGSPSSGTPEQSEVHTSLTDISLVAQFKISALSTLSVRASKIWVPEGTGYTGLLTWAIK